MSKIIGLNTTESEQTIKELKNKIVDYQKRHEELLRYEVTTMQELFNGSTITTQKNKIITGSYITPSEKLQHVIDNLVAIQKEIELIESFEGFIYE